MCSLVERTVTDGLCSHFAGTRDSPVCPARGITQEEGLK
jgi:hypothetical protein